MKNSIFTFSIILLLSLFFNTAITFAQSASGKTFYSLIEESEPVPKSINGAAFLNNMVIARIETDDKNNPFNGVSGVCEQWMVAMGEGNEFVHGVCIMADQAGDTFVTYLSYERNDESRAFFVKGGTGKFRNLDGKGTTTFIARPQTNNVEVFAMEKWTLKYKL